MPSNRTSWLLLTAGLALGCSDEAPGTMGAAGGAGGVMAGSGGATAGGGGGGAGGTAIIQAGQAGTAGAPVAGSGSGAAGGGGAAAGGAAGGGGGGTPPKLEALHYYGRWNLQQPGKAITVNSASHITAKFNGTGISAKFDTSGNGNIPTVRIEVDDGPPVEKEIASTLELASGLPPGEHTITLFVRGMNEFEARWTPPLVSATTFLGFTVAAGQLVPSVRPERLKLEFLGDSITEGVALHAQGPQGQDTPNWRTDGPRGYASLTARKMNAEWRQVGFGRQGVNIGGNGGVPKVGEAFNWFYAGVPRDDWQADLVVINQGTNDQFNGVDGATFAPLYRSLLELVRVAYPQAKIAALRPLSGGFGAEISAQVAALTAEGDAKIFYIDTAGWTSNGDFTDGVHPNEVGSVKIADQLVEALQALPD